MAVTELFRALGDPTRLEMVRRLSSGAPHTITSVSSGLQISRQGARKHLQILADAEVIMLEPRGRDTGVRLDRDTLEQGKAFIAELELRWDTRLEALRSFVDDE
ncbi:MAG: HTH-type transcriptional regulator [Candidatus Saccharibacteria bacterium]|nr:HTH-type transcriptional regulator [Candidatus Saccharibacteria bacterium]